MSNVKEILGYTDCIYSIYSTRLAVLQFPPGSREIVFQASTIPIHFLGVGVLGF